MLMLHIELLNQALLLRLAGTLAIANKELELKYWALKE